MTEEVPHHVDTVNSRFSSDFLFPAIKGEGVLDVGGGDIERGPGQWPKAAPFPPNPKFQPAISVSF